LVEALVLSIPAGLLGTWIVLRGLAFFSHAVGTAAFPGLVLAAGLGWPGPPGAALAAGAYTFDLDPLSRRPPEEHHTVTGLVAFAVVASLRAVGALLAAAIYVVPAATTRLWLRRLRPWQLASVALCAAESVAGLWLSVELNVPPGPAIAVLAGSVFTAAALARLGLPRLALLGVALLAGCGASASGGGSGPSVVATTTQIADWVRQVGGGDVSVHQILQPNTDPHEYEPRPKDVEATAGAKVVLESGDG